jgi:hypothetical protein
VKSSGREEKSSGREEKSSDREEKSSDREEKSSDGEAKSSYGEEKSSDREAKSSYGEEKSFDGEEKTSYGEEKSSDRKAKSSDRKAKNSYGEEKSFDGEEKTSYGEEKSSDREEKTSDRKEKSSADGVRVSGCGPGSKASETVDPEALARSRAKVVNDRCRCRGRYIAPASARNTSLAAPTTTLPVWRRLSSLRPGDRLESLPYTGTRYFSNPTRNTSTAARRSCSFSTYAMRTSLWPRLEA